jgi:hypothetical protein
MSSSLRPSRYTTTAAAAAAVPPSSAPASAPASSQSDRSALAYLLRYETLVRSQDAEDAATSDHLRPLFDRLRKLGGGGGNGKVGINMDVPGLVPSHSVSTDEGDPTAAADDASYDNHDNDDGDDNDEQLLTYDAMRAALAELDAVDLSFAGGAADKKKYSNGDGNGTAEVLTTDRQLMLLLRTMVDANANATTATSDNNENDGDHSNDDRPSAGQGLTYAEFLQAYKLVVGGMQTLQRIPKTANADDDDDDDGSVHATTNGKKKTDTRLQIRERTLDLIKLFGPPSNNNNNNNNNKAPNDQHSDDASCSSSVSSLPSLPGKLNRQLHITKGKKARKGILGIRGSSGGAASSNSSRGGGNKYRDPTGLPRDSAVSTLSVASVASTITDAEDVRRVLTIKDKAMLNLLSDHAGEMDDLTEKMADLSRTSKRRKSRMVLLGVAMGVLGLSIGLLVGGSHQDLTTTTTPAPSASFASSPSSTSSLSSPSHQTDLVLANELKYTKRELGQVNARVTKLQKRLGDAENDAKTSTAQLYDCRSDLTAAGREVDTLQVEMTLARDEVEACTAARTKEKEKNRAKAAAAASGGRRAMTDLGVSTAVVPVMKSASSAMAGASGAVLFPHIAKAVASGSLRVLVAAGGGLWTGVGLLVGAIISGAMPSLLNRNQ